MLEPRNHCSLKALKDVATFFKLAICISCNKSDVVEEHGIFKLQNSPQKWELVAIIGTPAMAQAMNIDF